MSVEDRVEAHERDRHLAATVHTRERQRRPTGSAPPLPRSIGATGKAWLCAGVVVLVWLIILAASEAARDATDRVDTAILEVVANLRADWLTPIVNRIDRFATGWAVTLVGLGTVVALIVFRRWRHLITLLGTLIVIEFVRGVLYTAYARPRPYGVTAIGRWAGFSFPSPPVVILSAVLMGVVYTLVVPGRPRQRAKYIVAGVLAVVCLSRMYLGVDHPFDLVLALIIGVGIPVIAFRWFTPNVAFPVAYKKGKTAHLDVTGKRGDAIRQAIRAQLGLIVIDIKPVGLEGSGGSTPLRLTVEGDPDSYLFAKLYSMTHVRSDRWYKWGRFLLYGRLEDEVPFQNVRRLIEYEDYTFRLLYDVGIPTSRSHGIVEITPAREYMLVTDFLAGAIEIGDAEIDDDIVDQGLLIIRHLWDAGLAHRDIKPANLMVRDGRILLIDVAFAELRPTPWRQAVDLANMMLCLALRSSPQEVYDRALRQFTVEEISEAFAAARGLALPSQLRRALRAEGRDIHGEFLRLLPEKPAPIKIQRWSLRRIAAALVAAALLTLLVFNWARLFGNNDNTSTPVNPAADCDAMEQMWLHAQAVPTAELVPCVSSLPVGWSLRVLTVNNGRSTMTLDHDRAGSGAIELHFAESCDVTGATEVTADVSGARRFERPPTEGTDTILTWYEEFPGGCVSVRLSSDTTAPEVVDEVTAQAGQVIGFVTRDELAAALDERSDGRLELDPPS